MYINPQYQDICLLHNMILEHNAYYLDCKNVDDTMKKHK